MGGRERNWPEKRSGEEALEEETEEGAEEGSGAKGPAFGSIDRKIISCGPEGTGTVEEGEEEEEEEDTRGAGGGMWWAR
jgi:hypothetical protein